MSPLLVSGISLVAREFFALTKPQILSWASTRAFEVQSVFFPSLGSG
jgi:hypothetical protein